VWSLSPVVVKASIGLPSPQFMLTFTVPYRGSLIDLPVVRSVSYSSIMFCARRPVLIVVAISKSANFVSSVFIIMIYLSLDYFPCLSFLVLDFALF